MQYRYTIILPVKYNDGKTIEPYKLDSALFDLMEIAIGFTAYESFGCYRMPDGTAKREPNITVWTVADKAKMASLKNLCKLFAAMFRQESIFFAFSPISVDYIRGN